MAPINNEILKPNDKATKIIRTEPKTDAAPFTANPQSINLPTFKPALGKGIPIKNPSGAISIAVISNLIGSSKEPKE